MWIKLLALSLVILTTVPLSNSAYASFHLYRINELYSNADGSIQFIELTVGDFSGESAWAGQRISVTQGGTTHSFTFPSNLPSAATGNTSVLVATQGFADLGILTPNFIVPSGFLFVGGGTVNFADVDSLTYSALPTGGNLSLNRDGSTGVNSPRNFAGVSGSISTAASSGTPAPQTPATVDPLSDCLFAWAETNYGQYFAPSGSKSLTAGPYYYRAYPATATYLATSSAGHVWILGPITGNNLFDAGPTAALLTAAGCATLSNDTAPGVYNNGYDY